MNITATQAGAKLVEAVAIVDFIEPGSKIGLHSHQKLSRHLAVWYITGFMVLYLSQQASTTAEDEQQPFSDHAGDPPSKDTFHHLQKQNQEDDVNNALDRASTRLSWFPSLGLSFTFEKGSTLYAGVTWGDYRSPCDGDAEKTWFQTPQCRRISLPIEDPGSGHDIPPESDQQDLYQGWISRSPPSKLGSPRETTRGHYYNPVIALQLGEKQAVRIMMRRGKTRLEEVNQERKERQSCERHEMVSAEFIQSDLKP